jgi:signal peptidase II
VAEPIAEIGENVVVSTPEPPAAADQAGVLPRTKMRVFFLVAVLALAADIISKVSIVAAVKPTDDPVRLLGGALYIVQARNSGAAFSVGTGATIALTVVSLVVVLVIIRAARKLTSGLWAVSLGLVLGGAVGNLVDRIFRAPSPGKGHVVDWISLFANDGHVWPIFNIADSCICVGGALAVLQSLRGVDFNGRRAASRRKSVHEGKPADPIAAENPDGSKANG